MNDNFNLRQFLTENRLTKASQVLAEAEMSFNVNKRKSTPGRGAKTENTTCKYSLQEVRKNYRKFLREGIDKRKAIALLSKVYPGLNLMEALMDDSRTRSLRESSRQNSEYFRARVHSGRSDQSDLEEAVANVSGEYLNDDEPEDWNKDIVWNVLGHEVRDVASDKDYQGQDTVMIDGKWACEHPQKLVDAITEKFNSNEVGEGRVVNTINPLVKGMRDDEDLYESRNRRTRSLRESSRQNSEYFRARVHSGRSDQSDLEEAVANVSGEYLNDDEPEDWNKDIVWNVLGHEVRDVASDKDYQGQDTVMIDGKWACECPQELVDAITEKFHNNEEGEGRVVNTINPLAVAFAKEMRENEGIDTPYSEEDDEEYV